MLFNGDMKTVDEIHRLNLAVLVEEFKGVGKLADQIGRSPSQVSQWLNASENSSTKKPRGMGSSSCRLVEKMCKKPVGWMDIEHEPEYAAEVSPLEDKDGYYQFTSAIEVKLLSDFRTANKKSRDMMIDLGANAEKVITPATAVKNK